MGAVSFSGARGGVACFTRNERIEIAQKLREPSHSEPFSSNLQGFIEPKQLARAVLRARLEGSMNEWFEYIVSFMGLAITIATSIRAFHTHRLAKQQRIDAWLRTFQNIHEKFWGDDDFATVREWLACPESYEKNAKEALAARSGSIDARTGLEHYSTLEKIDKFLNLLQRAFAVRQKLDDSKLWDRLFFGFWLARALEEDDLHWYVRTFYKDLYDARKLLKPIEPIDPIKKSSSSRQRSVIRSIPRVDLPTEKTITD